MPAATDAEQPGDPAEPVSEAAFERLMAPLGPWPGAASAAPVAVAVSGGADSLCLALLAARWARPHGIDLLGLVVDHRLRPESAREAADTGDRLRQLGISARTLAIDSLAHGSGLAERARLARYAALTEACRSAGAVDLLLGHHAGDQAETVLMRRRAGSGPSGLAGMASLVETDDVRLLRPLLGLLPEALRATLTQAGLGWVEDPSNQDRRAERSRVRQELASDPTLRVELLARQALAARARRWDRRDEAGALAAVAIVRPEGFAILPPALLPADALAALIRTVAGSPHRPATEAVASLLRAPRAATLGGARLVAAGRLGPGWLLVREAQAIAPARPAAIGALWDGRFRLEGDAAQAVGLTIAALGAARSRLRPASALPAVVLETLPSLWTRDGALAAVPHLRWCAPGYAGGSGETGLRFAFRPPVPASEAAWFVPG